MKPLMNNKNGFTLLEVLVSLAVLSIAFAAIIQATSQNIKDTAYIQQKTLARWVGNEIMSEIRVGLLKLPDAPDSAEQETTILGKAFFSKSHTIKTPHPNIQEIQVSVFQKKDDEPLIQLKSYFYVQ